MDFSALLNWITDASLVFSFLLAPLFYIWAVRKDRKISNVIYSWKVPGTAVLTIAAFAINLALFISTAMFFSGILGSRTYPELFTFSGDTMRRLALVSGSLLIGVTLFYLGFMRMLSQIVTSEGIWLVKYKGMLPVPTRELVTWISIQDYYYREDYPVRNYTFICKRGESRRINQQVKVPFPASADFERMLDHFLNIQLSEDLDYFILPDIKGSKFF